VDECKPLPPLLEPRDERPRRPTTAAAAAGDAAGEVAVAPAPPFDARAANANAPRPVRKPPRAAPLARWGAREAECNSACEANVCRLTLTPTPRAPRRVSAPRALRSLGVARASP